MTATALKLSLVDTAAGKLPGNVSAPAGAAPAVAVTPAATVHVLPSKAPIRLDGLKRGALSIASSLLPPLIVLAVALIVWELAAAGPKSSLPPPSKIWTEARDLIVDPFFVNGPQDIGLGLRVLTSLQRVAIGFGLAAVAGILLGALIGQSQWAMRGLDPLFQVLRTVPPLAWLPISLAAFRDANPSAIFVIFITAIWPVIINTAVGIRNIPQDYRNVAAVLRLNHAEFFWRIMIPSAAPYIFTGLRIGLAIGWVLVIVAEMLAVKGGIGYTMWTAYQFVRIDLIIAAMFTVGFLGLVTDRLLLALGQRLSRWSTGLKAN